MKKINSLGREAELGDLYDSRTCQFLEEESNVEGGTFVRKISSPHTVRIFDSLSRRSRYKALGLQSEEKLEVLLGVTRAEGHAEILRDDPPRNTVISKAAVYRRATEVRQLTSVDNEGVDKALKRSGSEHIYIVVGVELGIQSVLNIQKNWDQLGNNTFVADAQTKRAMEENANQEMEQFLLDIESSIQDSTSNGREKVINLVKSMNIDVVIYHDELPKRLKIGNNPSKVDKIELFFKIPGILSERNSKPSPLSYYLLPLKSVLGYELKAMSLEEQVKTPNDTYSSIADHIFETVICKREFIEKVDRYLLKGIPKEPEKFQNYSNIVEKFYRDDSSIERNFLSNLKATFMKFSTEMEIFQIEVRHILHDGNETTYMQSLKEAEEYCRYQYVEAEAFRRQMNDFKVPILTDEMSVAKIREELRHKSYFAFSFNESKPKFTDAKNLFLQYIQSSRLERSDGRQFDFIAVDLSCCPQSEKENQMFNDNAICFYDDGRFKCKDLLAELENDRNRNQVKFEVMPTAYSKQPLNRAIVKTACPLSTQKLCMSGNCEWFCEKCREAIKYSIDESKIFCACGMSPVSSCRFRCSSVLHGEEFAKSKDLESIVRRLPPVNFINILVIGESGVGKSTWINSIANYLTYNTLQEALDAKDLVCLIPTSFNVTVRCTKKEEVVVVGNQSDENENTKVGESGTQGCKSYVFVAKEFNVRIIDTAGIGDTRGRACDKENLNNMIDYLTSLGQINGICLLVKAKEPRVSDRFRYCVTELLKQLHISAAKNIIFCLTNARATNYASEQCLPALKSLLESLHIPSDILDLSKLIDRIFCFDNEAFKYICCYKRGSAEYRSDMGQYKAATAESWKNAWEVTRQVVKQLQYVKPHDLKSTVSLSKARRIIEVVDKPLKDLIENLTKNREELEEIKAKAIRDGANDKSGKLIIKNIRLKAEPRDPAVIVCTAERCTRTFRETGESSEKKLHTICAEKSQWYRRMWKSLFNESCSNCGCGYRIHEISAYSLEEITEEKEVASIVALEELIAEKENTKIRLEQHRARLERFCKRNALFEHSEAASGLDNVSIDGKNDLDEEGVINLQSELFADPVVGETLKAMADAVELAINSGVDKVEIYETRSDWGHIFLSLQSRVKATVTNFKKKLQRSDT